MADQSSKPRVIDDPALGEVYTDKLVSATFNGGALVVTLGAMRMVPETLGQPVQEPSVVVTARMALSPAAAIELVNAITGTLKAAETAARKEPTRAPSSQSTTEHRRRERIWRMRTGVMATRPCD